MEINIVMSKCSICGNSLNRYSINTIRSGLRLRGGFYTHKCNNCGTTYAPSSVFLLFLIAAFVFFEESIPSLQTGWLISMFVLAVIVAGAIFYLLPLSIFKKCEKHKAARI